MDTLINGTTSADAADADKQRRIAELRARKTTLETERQALTAPSLDDELAAAERAVADEEAINAAIQEHGKPGKVIEIIRTDIGVVIVKRASAMAYKKFQDEEQFDTLHVEQFVRPRIIYPELHVFEHMIDEQPMIVARCANALSQLAGVRKRDVEKK